MKIYKARNGQDNMIEGKSYTGYRPNSNVVVLTHVVSGDRVIQLSESIMTAIFNVVDMGMKTDIGLNPKAKPIKRGNRGVK